MYLPVWNVVNCLSQTPVLVLCRLPAEDHPDGRFLDSVEWHSPLTPASRQSRHTVHDLRSPQALLPTSVPHNSQYHCLLQDKKQFELICCTGYSDLWIIFSSCFLSKNVPHNSQYHRSSEDKKQFELICCTSYAGLWNIFSSCFSLRGACGSSCSDKSDHYTILMQTSHTIGCYTFSLQKLRWIWRLLMWALILHASCGFCFV